MTPGPSWGPLFVLGRLGAIVVRLVLIVGVVAASGLLLGMLFLPPALAANDVLAAVRTDVLDIPPLGEADLPPQNSYVYAADGDELAELTFEENRVPVELQALPQVVIDAVLATEDAGFYEHEGVNHSAIIRAALTNYRAGEIESGASTITQQYVKLTYLSPEQTLQRKINEAVYAIQLERELSKDEILERYLNRSYFGNGVYGIGTAAERYFSKDIADVSLGEAAMLAGLLRAPEANNPIRSFENAEARRDIVLRQMATHRFITNGQAQAAIEEPLAIQVSEPPAPEQPYWVEWVSRLLTNSAVAEELGSQIDALDAMGASFEERREMVFQSGLRIHTTLDPEMQDLAEATLVDHLTYEGESHAEIATEPMGALVSVEPGTGAIRAMALGPHTYGSCREDGSWVGEAENGQLLCDRTKVNPAVPGGGGSGRQPGSAFKPFLISAALEEGRTAGLTLDARGPKEIDGCPTNDGRPYTVRNSGGDGILDMYEAVQRSSNVYHALLIADIGPEKAAAMAERLTGFAIPQRDVVCPLALGATEMTPLAMASGYATLANRGERCAPFPISRIEDASGRTIWEHSPSCEQVLDTEIADRVVDIMAGPVSTGGTAPVANLGEWPTRGKTGTTNSYVDAWFVGYVKQLATAAWIGYPNGQRFYVDEAAAEAACAGQHFENECPPEGRRLENVTIAGQHYSRVFGGTIPAPMWADYMGAVVPRYEPEGFPEPGPIPTGQVPDLLSAASISEAERLAEEAGFSLDVEEIEDYRDAGTFVDQDPEAGSRLALGNRITLSVSDGEGDPPGIPDVVGLGLDEAANILFEAGYRVFRRDMPTDDEDLVDRVISMSPGPGTPMLPETPSSEVILNIGVLEEEPDDDDNGDDNGDEEPDDGGGSGDGDDDDGGNGDGDGDGDASNTGTPGRGVGPPGDGGG